MARPNKRRTAHGEDTRQIISAKIPDLKMARVQTVSMAFHRIDIVAPIKPWLDFEKQVRTMVENTNLPGEILHHEPAGPMRALHIAREHYACSDEGDIQGRFNHNVSNVMAAMYQSKGLQCKFSSGHATKTNCDGVPDVVLVANSNAQARLVGELKTSWMHDLAEIMGLPHTRRRCLGQIGKYMFHAGLQYGFLSTYEQTIFLAQRPCPHTGTFELWWSPVICHSTVSIPVSEQQVQMFGDQAYRDKVSLRECMMYLGLEVRANRWIANNNNPQSTFYEEAY